MNAIFEYIIAASVIILLVGWAFISISSSALVAVNRLEDERVNVLAAEIFDKLLLTPGDPVNWDTTNITSLGLAKVNAKEGFSLDREKVLSLKNESIDINTARSLLGLGNLYDFSLSITPALNISITRVRYNATSFTHSFEILVKDLKGLPAPTALVVGYYVNDTDDWNVGDAFARNSSLTEIDGRTTLDFTSSINPQNVTLLIQVKSSTAQYHYVIASKACYIRDSSVSSCGLGQPPKNLGVEGNYVLEGLPQIDAFTFPSKGIPGSPKMVSQSLYVSIDSYIYEAKFYFWSVSQ